MQEIIKIIKINMKRLFIINTIILLIGLILCFVLPSKYEATSIFVRGEANTTDMSLILKQFSFGSLEQSVSEYETSNIIETHWVLDKLIEKEDLINYYNLREKEDAYNIIINNTIVEDKKDGIIIVKYIDCNPEKAASICNSLVSYIDEFRKAMDKSTLNEYLEFLKTTAKDVENEINIIKDSIILLTQKYGVWLDFDDAGLLMNKNINNLRDSILNKEIEYRYYKKNSPNSMLTTNAKKELDFYYKQWNRLYEKGIQFNKGNYIVPSLKQTPGALLEFFTLKSNLQIKTSIYEMIMTDYYNNLFKLKKQVPSIKIIDRAVPPVKRSFPKRKLIILGFIIFALIFDVLFVQYYYSKNVK